MNSVQAQQVMKAADAALTVDAELRAMLEAEGIPQDVLKTDLVQPLTRVYLDAMKDAA